MCSSCRMLLEYCVCQWWQAQVTQSAQVCGRCSTRLRCTASSTSRGWVPASRKVRSTNLGSLSGIWGGSKGQDYTVASVVGSRATSLSPEKENPDPQWNEAQASFTVSFEKCACAGCLSSEESSQDALAGGQGVG